MISRGGFEVLGDLGDQDFDFAAALEKVKIQGKSGDKESEKSRSLDSDRTQSHPEEGSLDDGDDFQIVGGNKSGRSKTSLCRYFIQGTCVRGDACNFAHKVEQLSSSTTRIDKGLTEKEIQEGKNHPLYKTEMCRYYQNNSCHRGVDCCFAHSKAELRERPRFEEYQTRPKLQNPFPFEQQQQKPFAPTGPDLEGRLEEIWHQLENCRKYLFFGKIDAARHSLGEVRIEQIGNTAALLPEVSMRASVLKAKYQDLEKQISEGYNQAPQQNQQPPNAGSQQIRKELLKIIERAAYSEDIERLRSCVYDITPPLSETELGSLLWRCVVDVCKFNTVQILVSQWRGSDWTKLTVDSGLEGRKCLIHELVLKALSVETSESDAKGIISLLLQRRPRAVLDLYQGTTPLMLAIKKRASPDMISLLAPVTVPEALEVKCGVPPRNAIEEAEYLSRAVGISDAARKQYQNIYFFLMAKRNEMKR
ncbi:hypothetical protein BSKO_01463 [Bryopsis sp. KO-2023]|nr:hypothetical protein BSKO_01463 [Bryopsis sp. KO-2023]